MQYDPRRWKQFPVLFWVFGPSINETLSTFSWCEHDISPETPLASHAGAQFCGSGEPAASSPARFNDIRLHPYQNPTLPHLYLMRLGNEPRLALGTSHHWTGARPEDSRNNGPHHSSAFRSLVRLNIRCHTVRLRLVTPDANGRHVGPNMILTSHDLGNRSLSLFLCFVS